MLQQKHVFPPMPTIGMSETYYAKLCRKADAEGNIFAHETAKIGQYVTLALEPHLEWPAKVRFFEHALKRRCIPPTLPDEQVWVFYRQLADLVRRHAGAEASASPAPRTTSTPPAWPSAPTAKPLKPTPKTSSASSSVPANTAPTGSTKKIGCN